MTSFILPPPRNPALTGESGSAELVSIYELDPRELTECEGIGSVGFVACTGVLAIEWQSESPTLASALIIHTSESYMPRQLEVWLSQSRHLENIRIIIGQAFGHGAQSGVGESIHNFLTTQRVSHIKVTIVDSTLGGLIQSGTKNFAPVPVVQLPNPVLVDNSMSLATHAGQATAALGVRSEALMRQHRGWLTSGGRLTPLTEEGWGGVKAEKPPWNKKYAERGSALWDPNAQTCSCGRKFGRLVSGRHHCRYCGGLTCDQCGRIEILKGPDFRLKRNEWVHQPEYCRVRRPV